MSTTANYASTPRAALAQVSVANTARDGTGTLANVFTAGSAGSRVDDICITATGNTTAGVVRLFINDGANVRLWQEVMVPAIIPSTSVPVYTYTLVNQALVLPVNYQLRASTNNAETFNVSVTRAGDF